MDPQMVEGTPEDTLMMLQGTLDRLLNEARTGKVRSDTFAYFGNMISTSLEEQIGEEFPDIGTPLLDEMYEHLKLYDNVWGSSTSFEVKVEFVTLLQKLSDKINPLLPPRPS